MVGTERGVAGESWTQGGEWARGHVGTMQGAANEGLVLMLALWLSWVCVWLRGAELLIVGGIGGAVAQVAVHGWPRCSRSQLSCRWSEVVGRQVC